MLSGSLLAMTYKDKFSVKEFYKKRFLRILIPQFLAYILMFLFLYIYSPNSVTLNWGTLVSFLGLDLLSYAGLPSLWIVGEWFTTVIIIIYLIFPLLRYLYKKIPYISSVLVALIFVLNLHFKILSYENGWFSVTYGLFAFWIGMMIEKFREDLKDKKNIKHVIFYLSSVLCIVMIVLNPTNFFGIAQLPILFHSICLYVMLLYFDISCKVTDVVSKYNFEAYLLHHRLMILFVPMILPQNPTFLQLLLVLFMFISIIYLLSIQFAKLEKCVYSLIDKSKGKNNVNIYKNIKF